MEINFEDYISEKKNSIGFRFQISDEGFSILNSATNDQKKEYVKVILSYMTNNFASYNDKKFKKSSILSTSNFVELGIDSLDLVEIEIQLEELFMLHTDVLSLNKRDTISETVEKIFHNIIHNQKK